MLLNDLVETSQRVGETRKRLAKIDMLADCLRRAGPDLIEIAVGFLTGEPRQGRIGIGPAALRKARPGSATGLPSLTVVEVDTTLTRIAGISGTGSGKARLQALNELLGRGTDAEQSFLMRLLIGELRHGALEGVMADAIAKAADIPAAEVRRASMLAGDLRAVAVVAFAQGAAGLAQFSIQLFRPVQPMLAQPAEDLAAALADLEEAGLEYKLDGARVQVHKSGDDIRVFTRRLNDVTAAVPEVVELTAALPCREIILDGEALALRPDGRPQPFQVTMRRFGRKLDVAKMRESLPLRPVFFDCLYLDGDDLIDRPAAERIAAMTGLLPAGGVIPRMVTADAEAADLFLQAALEAGHEGIMAKSLAAPYEAGARGRSWQKIKPVHTLDLVILAAEWGHGRRRGWLSNLHLGAYDPAANGFVMLGKTFKGLTDEMLAWQTEKLLSLEIARDKYTVHVEPSVVVEIACNEIQESPQYPGGMALRFARVKNYRPDKQPTDADTIDTVRDIFEGRRAAVVTKSR